MAPPQLILELRSGRAEQPLLTEIVSFAIKDRPETMQLKVDELLHDGTPSSRLLVSQQAQCSLNLLTVGQGRKT